MNGLLLQDVWRFYWSELLCSIKSISPASHFGFIQIYDGEEKNIWNKVYHCDISRLLIRHAWLWCAGCFECLWEDASIIHTEVSLSAPQCGMYLSAFPEINHTSWLSPPKWDQRRRTKKKMQRQVVQFVGNFQKRKQTKKRVCSFWVFFCCCFIFCIIRLYGEKKRRKKTKCTTVMFLSTCVNDSFFPFHCCCWLIN